VVRAAEGCRGLRRYVGRSSLFFVLIVLVVVVEVLGLFAVLFFLFVKIVVHVLLVVLGEGERVGIGVAADLARGSADLTVPPREVLYFGFTFQADQIARPSHSILRRPVRHLFP
jgi:hypothetical protein